MVCLPITPIQYVYLVRLSVAPPYKPHYEPIISQLKIFLMPMTPYQVQILDTRLKKSYT